MEAGRYQPQIYNNVILQTKILFQTIIVDTIQLLFSEIIIVQFFHRTKKNATDMSLFLEKAIMSTCRYEAIFFSEIKNIDFLFYIHMWDTKTLNDQRSVNFRVHNMFFFTPCGNSEARNESS